MANDKVRTKTKSSLHFLLYNYMLKATGMLKNVGICDVEEFLFPCWEKDEYNWTVKFYLSTKMYNLFCLHKYIFSLYETWVIKLFFNHNQNLYIYLSLHLCMCMVVCMHICRHVCMYVSLHLSIYLSTYLSAYLPVYLSVWFSLHLRIMFSSSFFSFINYKWKFRPVDTQK